MREALEAKLSETKAQDQKPKAQEQSPRPKTKSPRPKAKSPRPKTQILRTNLVDAFDEALDLFLRRVAGASDANQSFRLETQPLHHGRGVKISVRKKQTLFRQTPCGVSRRTSFDRKRQGCRASRTRRWTIDGDSRHRTQRAPQTLEQPDRTRMHLRINGAQTLSPVRPFTQRRQEIDRRGSAHHTFLIS